MFTWVKTTFRAFFTDAGAFERAMRAFWGMLAGSVSAIVISLVATVGADMGDAVKEIASWTGKDWLVRLGVGGLFALANGRKTKALTLDEVHAGLAARGVVPPPPPSAK